MFSKDKTEMDEQINLLDDLNKQEIALDEYKQSNAKLRNWTYIFGFISFLFYVFFVDDTKRSEIGIPYLLGALIGFFLMISIPSAICGSIVAIFVNRNFPYVERYRKWLWIFSLGFAAFFTVCMGVASLLEMS